MRTSRANRGFTLLELLVVVSLMAVATGMGTVILIKMFSLWTDLKVGAELDRNSQAAFSAIEQDLSQAVSVQLAGVALKGEAGTGNDKQLFPLTLAQDKFTVPVQLPMVGGGQSAALVGYHIEQRSDGVWVLMRTTQSIRGGEAIKLQVAEGVLQMRVEYVGTGGTWVTTWSEPVHPSAVRVSLTLYNPNNLLRMQTARKAVFEVHVP